MDLIDREAVIEALWALDIEIRPSVLDAIADMLMTVPTVEPTQTNADSTQNCVLDCIDRKAAIEAMTSGVILVTNNNVDAVKKVIELFTDKIKNLPSAIEPGPRWIPCEESLPPSGTACFVTVECNGEKNTCISTFDHGTGWSNLEYGERVVSWMKLPEPWGGDEQ